MDPRKKHTNDTVFAGCVVGWFFGVLSGFGLFVLLTHVSWH